RSIHRYALEDAALIFHSRRQAAAQPQATEYRHEAASRVRPRCRGLRSSRSIGENRFDCSANQDFDGKSFPFVFVRWLLPLKLLMVNLANAFDDFHSSKKRPETFAVDHM